MLKNLIKKLKLKKPPPEDSVPFRIATMLTVLTGVTAILFNEDMPPFGYLVIFGTIGGYYVSHIRRNKKNTLIKVILSFLMIYAFINFLQNLRTNPYDPRVPLANLLMWLQTLHSFDLPSRRDLNYSMLVGLVLLGVAAVLTVDASIVIFYVLFIIFATATLIYNNVSRFNKIAENKENLPFQFIVDKVIYVSAALIITSAILVLFIPRTEGFMFRPILRSWVIKLPSLTRGRIVNPGQESADELRGKSGGMLKWNPNSYFGFNSYVNLNFRGRLSDEEIMKVVSSRWAYIRGLAFDVYDGLGWQITDEEEEDLKTIYQPEPPIVVDIDPDILYNWSRTTEIVQVFHVKKEMPNIIFGAYNIRLLYFPTESIYVDKNGGLRSPYPLEPGMIYSTVSRYQPLTEEDMKNVENMHRKYLNLKDRSFFLKYHRFAVNYRKYTQLPFDLPGRVGQLTEKIIKDTVGEDANDLVKAEAIASYLRETYPYDLGIPPFPDGHDTVDYFLFEERRGYCEHFASALAVMLRTQKIPSRMIFGYLPGDFDPVSNFYSVKQSDAHAWVEAYIPGYGWYSIDPTPGFDHIIYNEERNRNRWVFLSVLEKINITATTIITFLKVVIAAVLTYLAYLIYVLLKVHRHRDIKNLSKLQNHPLISLYNGLKKALRIIVPNSGANSESVHPAVRTYKLMLKELGKKGFNKKPSASAREYLNNTIPPGLVGDAGFIVEAFELARYGKIPPGEEMVKELNTVWDRLRIKIKEYGR